MLFIPVHNMSRVTRKPVLGFSDQYQHKTGCRTIEYGKGYCTIYAAKTKGADQLCSYRAADLLSECAFVFA